LASALENVEARRYAAMMQLAQQQQQQEQQMQQQPRRAFDNYDNDSQGYNIHTLVEIGDPAVFAIHVLERIRAEDYPALYRETRLITPIHFSYELVLNGIHGSTRQHQDSALPKAS
jgi:hypothetical protein